MTNKQVLLAKNHFLKTFKKTDDPVYLYLPRHVAMVEKWAQNILSDYPQVNKNVLLSSVWLHDIGLLYWDKETDHAVKSEAEAGRFLLEIGVAPDSIKAIAHCVRAHRGRDVQPNSLEAKILAAADSASHLTDINYLIQMSEGQRDYTMGKLERDYRDVSIFPKLKKVLTPLYLAWKRLLLAYPDTVMEISDRFKYENDKKGN